MSGILYVYPPPRKIRNSVCLSNIILSSEVKNLNGVMYLWILLKMLVQLHTYEKCNTKSVNHYIHFVTNKQDNLFLVHESDCLNNTCRTLYDYYFPWLNRKRRYH